MIKRFSSPVLNAILIVSIIGILSRGLGFIREMTFAAFFGVSSSFDLYLVSVIIPVTIHTIGIYIAQNYIIPEYNRLKDQSILTAIDFIKSSLSVFTFLSIILAVILFFSSNWIFSSLLSVSSDIELGKDIFKICLLSIPLNGAFSVIAAYNQAEFNFKLPALAQLSLNVAIILLIILFSGSIHIYSIALGYVSGSFLQLIILLIPLSREVKIFPIVFSFKDLKSINNSKLIITIIIESLSQLYLISDRILYEYVDAGGIASLNYANNLFFLPILVFSMAISTVALPNFSKWFNDKDILKINDKSKEIIKTNLFIFIPISIIFIFNGDTMIKLLFQRGKFDISATEATFSLLRIFSISLIFLSMYSILNKLFYSFNLVKELMVITILGISLKIILNIILVHQFRQEGLAISSTISYSFFFLACSFYITRKKSYKIKFDFFPLTIFFLVGGVVSWLISGIILNGFPDGFIVEIIKVILFILLYISSYRIVFQKSLLLEINRP